MGRKIAAVHQKHICNREVCHPVSEQDLKNCGALSPSYVPHNPYVYVCELRSVHVCTTEDCSLYIGTHTGVCPVTGIYHGHTEGEKAYVMPEKRTATFRRKGVARGMDSRTALGIQHDSLTKHDAEIQDILTAQHGEQQQQDNGITTTNNNNVFGALAVLSKKREAVREDATIGDDADEKKKKNDMTAPDPPPPPRKKIKHAQQTPANVAYLREIAEDIIRRLLYSPERRHINAEKRRQLMERKEQEIRNYYHKMSVNKRFPVMVDVIVSMAHYDMEPPYLNILRYNEDRVRYYVDVVLHTWFVVVSSPWIQKNPGFQFKTHAFCVLYMMRKGLTIGGVVAIPKEKFMTNLPVRVDLPTFSKDFASKVLTNGQRNIKEAYKSMQKEGIPEQRYMFNFDRGTFTATTTSSTIAKKYIKKE